MSERTPAEALAEAAYGDFDGPHWDRRSQEYRRSVKASAEIIARLNSLGFDIVKRGEGQ